MTSARQKFSKARAIRYAFQGQGGSAQPDLASLARVLFGDQIPPNLPNMSALGLDGEKIFIDGPLGHRPPSADALDMKTRLKPPMTYEQSPRRLLNLPPSTAPATHFTAAEAETEWRGVVSVLSAIDELAACASMDLLLRQSVEVARSCIGLERAGLYVADQAPSKMLRGAWGTGICGETTDERELGHDFSETDRERMLDVQRHGARWLYFENADHIAQEPGRSVVIGRGWLAITPLVSEGELVGLLYNDTAFTHVPIDLGKQVRAAVFCSLLAQLIVSRRKGVSARPPQRETERGSVVRQVQRALNHNPLVSGEHLARELNISAGYLARVFKTEVGVSLVEYRNRLRIERFLRLVERGGGNLYEAAIEAGFGSYAQFHRVFRRQVGTTPREYVTGSHAGSERPVASAQSELPS